MKIGIVGSRRYNNYSSFVKVVGEFLRSEDTLVSGGAKGADSLAEKFAKDIGVEIKVFKADWDKYGNSAGMIRNGLIVEESDFILAFWDGKSKGTKDTITKCENVGKECIIFDVGSIIIEDENNSRRECESNSVTGL